MKMGCKNVKTEGMTTTWCKSTRALKKEGAPECGVKVKIKKMTGKGILLIGILLIGILLLLVLIGMASAKTLAVDVASDSDTNVLHSDAYTEKEDLNNLLPLQSEHGAVSTVVQSALIIMLMMLLLRFMKTLYIQVFIVSALLGVTYSR